MQHTITETFDMILLSQLMDYKRYKYIVNWWPFIPIALLAWIFQASLLPNSDATWLMEASKRLLAGGTYTRNFFELNPPMTLYIYFPAVILTKWASLSPFTALRLYLFILITGSLYVCNRLIHQLIAPTDHVIQSLLFITLCLIFFFLPMNEFGQREHFLIVLSMPYFLLATTRLSLTQSHPHEKTHRMAIDYWPLFIGLLAGIGFAIKPYFLCPLALTELYILYKTHTIRALARPELLGISFIIGLYLLTLLSYHQDYLTVIVPLVSHFYYQEFHSPMRVIFFGDQSCFIYIGLLFYFIRYKHPANRELMTVLMLATIGFYLSYCIQRTHWFYHALPMLSFNLLLITLLFSELITRRALTKKDFVILILFSLGLFIYLAYRLPYIWLSIVFYPLMYFSLMAALFTLLLYVAHDKKNPWPTLRSIAIIFVLGYLLYLYVNLTVWAPHVFFFTTMLLLACYIFSIPNTLPQAKARFSLFAMVGLLLLAYPCYQLASTYAARRVYQQQYFGLINALRAFPGKSVVFFTDSGEFPFPATTITGNPLATRFAGVIGLPHLNNTDDTANYISVYQKNKKPLSLYLNAIVEDLNTFHAELIFVDERGLSKSRGLGYYGADQIDYLKLFMLNPGFQRAWRKYHFIKTIDGQPLYLFAIYARNSGRIDQLWHK